MKPKNISKLPLAGYSGTPLINKLGIKDNFRIRLIGEPEYCSQMLNEVPALVFVQKNVANLTLFIFLKQMRES